MNIEIQSVDNKGDQTKEQVTLKVINKCDIGYYILFDSSYTKDGKVSNKVRHTYWFPNQEVQAGDYVFLFTKPGTYGTHKNKAGTTTHNFYWNMNEPVWNDDGDFATLVEAKTWKSKPVKG